MKSVIEQRDRIDRYAISESHTPQSKKRTEMVVELQNAIADIRTKYPRETALVTQELRWIMATSSAQEYAPRVIKKHLESALNTTVSSAMFSTTHLFRKIGDSRAVTVWLKRVIENDGYVNIDNVFKVTIHQNHADTKRASARFIGTYLQNDDQNTDPYFSM